MLFFSHNVCTLFRSHLANLHMLRNVTLTAAARIPVQLTSTWAVEVIVLGRSREDREIAADQWFQLAFSCRAGPSHLPVSRWKCPPPWPFLLWTRSGVSYTRSAPLQRVRLSPGHDIRSPSVRCPDASVESVYAGSNDTAPNSRKTRI